MENKNIIPTKMQGTWYLSGETMIHVTQEDDFNLTEFCKAYYGFKISEELRKEAGEEYWEDMQETYAQFEAMANAVAFQISENSVESEMVEYVKLLNVITNENETIITVENSGDEDKIETTTLTMKESEDFFTFIDGKKKSGTLVRNPVDLIFGLSLT
jgi:hypothetical protein